MAVGLALLVGALRAAYLFVFPLDLAGDEAYYWDWGRRPDWCYFSKPPMIGWVMNLAERLFGDTGAGIRLMAPVLGTGSLLMTALLTRRLFGARTALLAVALAAFSVASAALNIVLTIDAPLVFFWTTALYLFWRMAEPGEGSRWPWAIALGVVLGLGHLSKQMMLVFPVMGLIFLIIDRRPKVGPRIGKLVVASLISLLFLIPPLVWNANNDWITYQHTTHHFSTSEGGQFQWLEQLGAFAGSQLLLLSPLTWILIMVLLICATVRLFKIDRRVVFLTVFSAPALFAILFLSLRQGINPNWPAVFYVAALILVAAWLTNQADGLGGPKALRRWGRPAVLVGFFLMLITYLSPWIIDGLGWQSTKKDPLSRLRGWTPAGAQLGEIWADLPRPDETFLVVLGHRDRASQLAYHTPQQPTVYRFEPKGAIRSQYEVWPNPEQDGRLGQDALVVNSSVDSLPYQAIRNGFESFSEKPVGIVDVDIGNGERRYFRAYLARDLRSWPVVAPQQH